MLTETLSCLVAWLGLAEDIMQVRGWVCSHELRKDIAGDVRYHLSASLGSCATHRSFPVVHQFR